MDEPEPLTYAQAGVDIEAGDRAVARIKAHVRSTHRPEVIEDTAGFGGLFSVDALPYESPVLVASTDGVGTKSDVARLARKYDTIGIDLVGTGDDIAAQGADPLFFQDYISVGVLEPEMIDEIVRGVAGGCRTAGFALLGGEMSEHPGAMEPGAFDLVGFAVGAADRSLLLPRDVGAGDALVGIASPGLRCNGYTLARRALFDRGHRRLDEPAWPGADRSLGDELLVPSVIYAPALARLRREVEVHALAHITGGGLSGNVARVLPDGCEARIRRGSWEEPRIFREVQAAGEIADAEMERVFNLGIGMVAVVPASAISEAIESLARSRHAAWHIGEIARGAGRVTLTRD
ncbi:MAG TPA: phosphoribosylformylglycinamidine cyclo-ligase [Acidimicrobiia bacterium]